MSELLGRRVLFKSNIGTIRYAGPLIHPIKEGSKIDPNAEWLGVEWDDEEAGKHDGTVEGYQYFVCQKPGFRGSLVKSDKVEFGKDFVYALIDRYFQEHETAEIMKHRSDIVGFLKSIHLKEKQDIDAQLQEAALELKNVEQDSKNNQPTNIKSEQETTISPQEHEKVRVIDAPQDDADSDSEDMFLDDEETDDQKAKASNAIDSRQAKLEQMMSKRKDKDTYLASNIKVQYDEDAYIATSKDKVKRIEFVGFDRIWERLHDLGNMRELSLNDLGIKDFSEIGELKKLCGNIRSLFLEHNLLRNWEQVLLLGIELRQLENLALSYNQLEANEIDLSRLRTFNDKQEIGAIEENQVIFPCLRTLVLIGCDLNFKKMANIIKWFPNITELVLCKNEFNDFENFDPELYQQITHLNLEDNKIISGVHRFERLQELGNLSALGLRSNKIHAIESPEKFTSLESTNLSENGIVDNKIFECLRKMPKLKYLRFTKNPLNSSHAYSHLRQWCLSEIPNLISYNGATVTKGERTDSEYYFMRWCFHEYFRLHQKTQLSYKYADFESWVTPLYPICLTLIEKHENPYPELSASLIHSLDTGSAGDISLLKSSSSYIRLYFVAYSGVYVGRAPISKRFPSTTDFFYIKNWALTTFKFKNKAKGKLLIRNRVDQMFEEVLEYGKILAEAGVWDCAEVAVDGDEE